MSGNGNRLWHIAAGVAFLLTFSAPAAIFPGNARLEVADSTGALSWNPSANALIVQCWFKISIPSGFVPTENMTILVNNSTNGTTSQNHAYHLYYNYSKRTIEFSTRGSGGYWQATVIDQPWPDRWYHVAVARGGTSLKAYVDGRLATNATPPLTVGDSRSTAGVSIGGWGNSKYLYGEVQEVLRQQIEAPSQPSSGETTESRTEQVWIGNGDFLSADEIDPMDIRRSRLILQSGSGGRLEVDQPGLTQLWNGNVHHVQLQVALAKNSDQTVEFRFRVAGSQVGHGG